MLTREMAGSRLLFAGDHELGGPQQRTFDLRVGEGADGFAGGLGILAGGCCGSFNRAITRQDFENVSMSGAIKRALLDDGCNLLALRRGATLERVNDRHRD